MRLPASYCGVIGFKPSYGLLSRWGVVAYANSLDTVGILARNTDEARSVFALLSKHDPMDPTSISAKTRQRVKENILGIEPVRINRPLRIGFPHEYNVEELSPLVRQAWLHTLQGLAEQGHEIVPLSLPNTKPALGAYYILASAEASSNLARYDGLRYGHRSSHDRSLKGDILYAPTREMGFGDEVRRRILLGTYALSSEAVGNYFQQAQRVRRLVQQDFDAAFLLPNFLRVNTKERKTKHYLNHGGVDAIIAPTALGIAPKINDVACAREVDALAGDVLTVPASLAGIPSISVPVSLAAADDYEGGTVGIQVMTQWGDESMMFRVAQKVQKLGGIRRGLGLYPIGINESKFKVLFPEDERRKDLKSSSVIPSETKPLESELKDEPSEVGPKDPSQSV